MKNIQGIKEKACRYWFIILVWVEWLLMYALRAVLMRIAGEPFIRNAGDSVSYDAFQTLKVFDQGARADAPVYGMLLDFFELLFGDGRFAAIVVFQIVVSAIALVYFYRTLLLAGIRGGIARAILLLYGFSLSASGWNVNILTESLSLSGFIFVLYNVLRLIRYERLQNGVAAIGLTFVLCFLRPQFLLHYAVLVCYFVLKAVLEKQGRCISLRLMAICLGGGILILGYCALFMNAYGIFSLSSAKARQQFDICINQGYYKSYPDPAVVATIDACMKEKVDDYEGRVVRYVNALGHKKMQQIANVCIARNFPAYLRYLLSSVIGCLNDPFAAYGFRITPMDNLRIGHAILISGLQGLAMIGVWIRRRRPPWIHMGLFAYSFPVIWTTFIMTWAEFMRTMLYIVPVIYCSLGLFAEWYLASCGRWKERFPLLAEEP